MFFPFELLSFQSKLDSKFAALFEKSQFASFFFSRCLAKLVTVVSTSY